jgi:molecular chaperone DnaK (HSP70)
VEVSFSVDTNGILQVYAVDLKSGRRIDVEMERDDGFNETAESVKKAAEDAAAFDVFLG